MVEKLLYSHSLLFPNSAMMHAAGSPSPRPKAQAGGFKKYPKSRTVSSNLILHTPPTFRVQEGKRDPLTPKKSVESVKRLLPPGSSTQP